MAYVRGCQAVSACECQLRVMAAGPRAVTEVSVCRLEPSNLVVVFFLYKWVEPVLD